MRPKHFFVRDPLRVVWQYRPEDEVHWELFLGRALDHTQTRERRTFETWAVCALDSNGIPSAEPLVAIRRDAAGRTLFVTRAILCHGSESHMSGQNVIESRSCIRWQRELVGSITVNAKATCGAIADELACLLFQAVVGTSRLPLTSVEAPLPDFTLGRFGYWYRPGTEDNAGPMHSAEDVRSLLSDLTLATIERAKLLELYLRAENADKLPATLPTLLDGVQTTPGSRFAPLLEVFNGASLSPYTDFVDKTMASIADAVAANAISAEEVADGLTALLRLIGRHLVAYDLVTFHHRGANYPDALLLDAVLGVLLPLVERAPNLIGRSARLRRRGLRLALLARDEYRGHLVPDVPTSSGENARVLPEAFARIADEQILSPAHRRRRLFTDGASCHDHVLRELLNDLDDPRELCELGTGLFLDRPLGACKQVGEPDQTLLMAHVLFSRSVAARRIERLTRRPELLSDLSLPGRWLSTLESLCIDGLPLKDEGPLPRAGVVSLHDTFRVADDFLLLRTARRTIDDLLRQYDFRPLCAADRTPAATAEDWRLVVPTDGANGSLRVYDTQLCPRFDLRPDYSQGTLTRGGVELVAAGLVAVRLTNTAGAAAEDAASVRLCARFD